MPRRLPELILALALSYAACGGPSAPPAEEGADPGTQLSDASQPLRSATLFFVDRESGLLTPCEVQLPLTGEPGPDATLLLSRYFQGSPCEELVSPYEEGTQLRAVFILEEGTAVVDLSGRAAAGGGGAMETLRIYGVVNTLAANFSRVRSVRFLVDGREIETLLGHVDLLRPIPPEPSLLLPSAKPALSGAAP